MHELILTVCKSRYQWSTNLYIYNFIKSKFFFAYPTLCLLFSLIYLFFTIIFSKSPDFIAVLTVWTFTFALYLWPSIVLETLKLTIFTDPLEIIMNLKKMLTSPEFVLCPVDEVNF